VKILLTGPTGQVGSALLETLPALGEVVPLDRRELDLANADSIRSAVRRVRPHMILNAAAYTAVDEAERKEGLALQVNRDGPGLLAEEAARLGALLVHFSTDYVFDGEKADAYVETDTTHPLNAYGRSKLAGEQAIQASGCQYLIFRTSWVYGPAGKNFMLTMLRFAREGKPLRVVDDQYGAPTSSIMIARAVVQAIPNLGDQPGLYHLSASGSTTWHGFAQAIFAATGTTAALVPVRTGEFPTIARRPRNSRLNNAKLVKRGQVQLAAWEDGLREVLQALR
jgi:dTDP-4-dehydrorhamnose reductase